MITSVRHGFRLIPPTKEDRAHHDRQQADADQAPLGDRGNVRLAVTIDPTLNTGPKVRAVAFLAGIDNVVAALRRAIHGTTVGVFVALADAITAGRRAIREAVVAVFVAFADAVTTGRRAIRAAITRIFVALADAVTAGRRAIRAAIT